MSFAPLVAVAFNLTDCPTPTVFPVTFRETAFLVAACTVIADTGVVIPSDGVAILVASTQAHTAKKERIFFFFMFHPPV